MSMTEHGSKPRSRDTILSGTKKFVPVWQQAHQNCHFWGDAAPQLPIFNYGGLRATFNYYQDVYVD